MTRGQQLAVTAAVLAGMAAGLGFFTFGYARGYSYLTNDPGQCANCHIMAEHFSAWIKASHRSVATCNDCHTPHNLVAKYMVKARNGFWHSFYFTTGRYPDPLRITERNRKVTENACRYCHSEITEAIDHVVGSVAGTALAAGRTQLSQTSVPARSTAAAEPISCVRCHRYVGHWVR
jgi:cytochrome c nitrite reductase small subunit